MRQRFFSDPSGSVVSCVDALRWLGPKSASDIPSIKAHFRLASCLNLELCSIFLNSYLGPFSYLLQRCITKEVSLRKSLCFIGIIDCGHCATNGN